MHQFQKWVAESGKEWVVSCDYLTRLGESKWLANLKQLSPALKSFVELFDVDRDLIATTADTRPTSQAIAKPIEAI